MPDFSDFLDNNYGDYKLIMKLPRIPFLSVIATPTNVGGSNLTRRVILSKAKDP